ncbi:hypothetical protein OOZ19_18695 [Saccharopolyspora sp. NFXS83]|uniref:hypothetical protein n=1 Tax=Saccharopolyspora sp. NFXS83 TaxID=2993560 RepID=UPI00224A7F9C|nr:hypothetical protein [Saccharopolyspora sp. NFXS83]MCX2732271.1 hypothetical protein [Saccharopolyspora sp. NFXS83]
MKWLPGGWQRADRSEREWATVPGRVTGKSDATARFGAERGGPGTRVYDKHDRPAETAAPIGLGPEAQDVDVSAGSFRLLLIGGGLSGFGTVLCAATLANNGSSVGVWIWQLVLGIIFLGFVLSSRGMLNSRGFLLDRSGFYARTLGEVYGVSWNEISAIGIGSLPWIEQKRPVHPERRVALEFYPADPGFGGRHPELDRWRVEEQPSLPGTSSVRYRFHLPPFTRLPRAVERAVQTVAPRKWVGHYRRHLPPVSMPDSTKL